MLNDALIGWISNIYILNILHKLEDLSNLKVELIMIDW